MLEDLDWHWLLWLFALVPAFYLLVPLVIWPLQRFPAHPDITELDTRTLRKSLRHFLMTQANDLFELGFGEPTMAEVPGPLAMRRRARAILDEFDRGMEQ